MSEITLKGNCYLCGKAFAKSAYKKHLMSAHAYEGADGQDCVILKVEGAEDRNYWLYLDMAATSTLKSLDDFLRKIWLECCGHLSGFYSSGWGNIAKSDKVSDFRIGSSINYEYDFGSTTSLKITFVANSVRPKQRKAVRLLARNEPYEFTCAKCGEPAVLLCVDCMWSGRNPFLCLDCAEEHGHSALLPVTNSPRMGTCGYCGDLDEYEFDPKAFEK